MIGHSLYAVDNRGKSGMIVYAVDNRDKNGMVGHSLCCR